MRYAGRKRHPQILTDFCRHGKFSKLPCRQKAASPQRGYAPLPPEYAPPPPPPLQTGAAHKTHYNLAGGFWHNTKNLSSVQGCRPVVDFFRTHAQEVPRKSAHPLLFVSPASHKASPRRCQEGFSAKQIPAGVAGNGKLGNTISFAFSFSISCIRRRISAPFALQSATVTLGVAAAALINPCFIVCSSCLYLHLRRISLSSSTVKV